MILSSLSLCQFRSYTNQSFTFSPGITLLLGDNGAGKTNILESIYILATGKSFRANLDIEMIRWGESFCRFKAQISDETTLEILVAPAKKYLVNGVARRQIDFVGSLRAVLFWPEHMELVTDSPSVRRRYLDSVLVQVDREYRRNLLSYERALRQRNRLLDLINGQKASRGQLIFWNQLLIAAGGYITDKRAEFINFINEYRISDIVYRIEYDKSIISESRLEQYKDEEVAAKATLVGPHRDDMIFLIGDKSLSSYGSRGEQRLAILWLKLAELSFIENITGYRPVLLLDDIFSELDESHKKLVFEVVSKQQTIITTADPAILKEKELKNVWMIQL